MMQNVSRTRHVAEFENQLHHMIEIEKVVLGAAILEPFIIPTVVSLLIEDSFFKIEHQLIFQAITHLYSSGKEIDIITVTNQLRSDGQLDRVGGPYYITTLTNRVASSANTEEHCRIIIQQHVKRLLIKLGAHANELGSDESKDAFDSMETIDRQFQQMGEIIARGGNMQSTDTILSKVKEVLQKQEQRAKNNKCTGIPTGFAYFDTLTGGWQNSELIILAARPSMGKTALMLHFAMVAAKNDIPICIYSLEMSDISLMNRLILSITDIEPQTFKTGKMSVQDWSEFERAKIEISKLPIYIDDNALVSMNYIKSHSRLMKAKGRCGMILIDYLQLLDMKSNDQQRNREQDVSMTSRQAKIVAKSLQVPIILLSQLSRAVESRGGDKIPLLSDLRDSGAIEQDADMVLFVFREEYYKKENTPEDEKGVGKLIIAKNRNGGTDNIGFRYNQSMTKITDIINSF